MFAKLLIAGRFACALLLLWAGASIMGWAFVLPIFAVGLPVCWQAHTKPERWGWLIGRRPPPPPPVDRGSQEKRLLDAMLLAVPR